MEISEKYNFTFFMSFFSFKKQKQTSLKLHLDYDREQMEDFGQTEINVSWRY